MQQIQQPPQQNSQLFDPRMPASQPSTYNNRDLMTGYKKAAYRQDLQDQVILILYCIANLMAQMRINQERKYNQLQKEREHDHSLLQQRVENDPFGK